MRTCFLLLLLTATAANADKPVISKTVFSKPKIKFDMADQLVGTSRPGRLVLKNDTGKVIELEKVTTSCGCTTAEPATGRTVEPDKFAVFDLNSTPKREGGYGVIIKVISSHGENWLLFQGTAVSQFAVEPKSVVAKDGIIKAALVIYNDADPKTIKIEQATSQKIDGNRIEFTASVKDWGGKMFPLMVSIDGKKHDPVVIQVLSETVRLPTTYIRPKDGVFKLFIHCAIELPETKLLVSGKVADCEIEETKIGDETHLLLFDSATELIAPVELTIGDQTFPLHLPR